jgi:hypothetical protein
MYQEIAFDLRVNRVWIQEHGLVRCNEARVLLQCGQSRQAFGGKVRIDVVRKAVARQPGQRIDGGSLGHGL